ncbi:MAG: chromosomal replication initiator protein DnaA [Spirochaetia bacterium]
MSSQQWDYKIFWNETINQIRSSLSEQEFYMWFNNISYLESKENTVVVAVPSNFYRDQVKQRYLTLIEDTLYELSGFPIKLEFQTIKITAPEKKDQTNSANRSEPQVTQHQVHREPVKEKPKTHPHLRNDYIFDTFVVGENNSFAANAAIAISKNPGTAFNPCLIYGGVGLGKTHLLQSIGNSAYTDFDNMRIVYVTAETFTNEFIQSIRESKTHKFKNKYRSVDILLIDDIHFLQSKTETQEELFHTFNALYDTNKQLVFTCDRPVSELKQLSDRLRSRFERGLNVDLQPPSYETRYAILKQKLEIIRTPIPEEVIDIICKNITTNVRDIEAAITKLIAYAELLNKEITIESAQQLLKDMFSSPRQSNITVDVIQRVVAEYFGLSHNDLKGRKKTKAIAFPRQVAMYITREMTEYSTTEVGLEFGGRDHTTVMHACSRIENKMRTDPTLEPIIQQLIRQIKEYGTK